MGRVCLVVNMKKIPEIMKINFHINPIYFGSYSCGTGLILPEGSEVYSSSPVGNLVHCQSRCAVWDNL